MAQEEATLLLRIKKLGADALDEVTDKIGSLKTLVFAAGAAIAGFAYASIKAFREQELASNQLSQAMVQQGVYTTELKKKYDDMASALQRVTTFGDEQITAAQATLQAFVGQREVTEGLVKATLDLAAAKGMDLNSAAQLVGKSIAGEANALQRYGIEVEKSSDKTQKMANVIDALNSKFGGQASAMAQGLGSIEVMKNAMSDFMETVGQRLAPLVTLGAQAVTKLFQTFSGGSPILDDIIRGLYQLTAQAILFVRDFEVVGKVIGNVFGGLVGTIANLVQGNWKDAWNSAKSIVTVSMDDITESNKKAYDRIAGLEAAYLEGKEGNLRKEEELIKASNERKNALREEQSMKEAEKQLELDIAKQDRMIAEAEMEGMDQQQKLAQQMKFLDEKIKNEENFHKKQDLVRQRGDLAEAQANAIKQKNQEELNKKRVQDQEATLNTIATLQQSNNSTLAAIGKAAAITQIAIETPVAIAKALSAFPPPFNFAAAGLVGAAMAAQAARIAGVQLADGGIVSARPGGIQATIGEGGRDEAVIPLPDDFDPDQGLGGGKVTLVVNGPILGNEDQARQFAVAIDRELLKLRQRNESVAFDEGTF